MDAANGKLGAFVGVQKQAAQVLTQDAQADKLDTTQKQHRHQQRGPSHGGKGVVDFADHHPKDTQKCEYRKQQTHQCHQAKRQDGKVDEHVEPQRNQFLEGVVGFAHASGVVFDQHRGVVAGHPKDQAIDVRVCAFVLSDFVHQKWTDQFKRRKVQVGRLAQHKCGHEAIETAA